MNDIRKAEHIEFRIKSKTIEFEDDITAKLRELKDHDSYTYLHSINVCALSVAAAYFIGLPVRDVAVGAILHDMGKLHIDRRILCSPYKLLPSERSVIKEHPLMGMDIACDMRSYTHIVGDIVLNHHERVNGMGYPSSKHNISLSVQIVSVADVFDALTHDRPYRAGFASRDAWDVIKRGYCGYFNPTLLDCLEPVYRGDIKTDVPRVTVQRKGIVT